MKRKAPSTAAAPSATVVTRQWLRPTGERTATPPRELARRVSGTVEVLLQWYSETNRVELAVRESTGAELHIDVPPTAALDAFYHPYTYVANETESVDA